MKPTEPIANLEGVRKEALRRAESGVGRALFRGGDEGGDEVKGSAVLRRDERSIGGVAQETG